MAKVLRKSEGFQPVTIILETQEEVDKMYTIFNFSWITDIVGINDLWTGLSTFKTDNYAEYHEELNSHLKEKYKAQVD